VKYGEDATIYCFFTFATWELSDSDSSLGGGGTLL
jgi:hypothetical protein